MQLDKTRFGLTGPRDLLRKLELDLGRLKTEEHTGREHVAYIVFDCAVTAWSVLDWTLHAIPAERRAEFGITTVDDQKALRQFRKYLVTTKGMRRLETCHDLATGAKHFYVDSSRQSELSTSVIRSGRVATEGPNAGSRETSYWPILHVDDLTDFADEFFWQVWLEWKMFLDDAKLDTRDVE